MNLEKTATNLVEMGYSVIPIGEKKRPYGAWKEFQDRKASVLEISRVLKSDKVKGIGIVCGVDGLEVVDVDLKVMDKLVHRRMFWKQLLGQLRDNIEGFDGKFVIYETMSGGYHILYRCAVVEGNAKLAKVSGSKEAVLETRGVGGYVYVYERRIGELSYGEIKEVSAKERAVLMAVCRGLDGYNPNATVQGDTPWGDYDKRTDVWSLLQDEFEMVSDEADRWIIKRFGATSEHSGYIYKDTGLLYLFSTGTRYPAEHALSPSSVFAFRYHGGNFSMSAKDLLSKGYGSRVSGYQPTAIQLEQDDLVFPIEVFPVEFADYMKKCNATLGHITDYMGCSLLWSMSLIIGNSIRVKLKNGYSDVSVVWFALVGGAGIGKTHSINAMVGPLKKMNGLELQFYAEKRKEYDDYNKLEKTAKKGTDEVPEPGRTQFIVGDVTLEALADMHQDRKNGIGILKDELAGWFKDMNKYRAGSDIENWLSMWSGDMISINRKTAKDAFVKTSFVPVLGGIQPDVLDGIYTEDFKSNGFTDRMLLCYPDAIVPYFTKEEMDYTTMQTYESTITDMYNWVKGHWSDPNNVPLELRLSPEAMVEYERIHRYITDMENGDTENEYMKSMLPKQKTYLLRFALIMQFMWIVDNGPDLMTISKDSILRAERLCKYFIAMAKKVKIRSAEKIVIRKVSEARVGSVKDKFMEIYRQNPGVNKSSVASLLNVSRRQIYNWIEDAREQDNNQ